jgi:RNA polymerase sigma-70 factor, ECF subfamily
MGSGSDQHFEAMLTKALPALRAYARALSDFPSEADDVVGETLARAWQYADSFDACGSFEGWVLRICRNQIIDAQSRAARRREALQQHYVLDPRSTQTSQPTDAVDLQDLVDRLPIAQREVVVLVVILGYSYDETASLLDQPVGTIRSRLHRARTSLADAIKDPNPLIGSA